MNKKSMNNNTPQPPSFNLPKPVVDAPQPHIDAQQPPQTAIAEPIAREGETLDPRWIHAVENLMRQGIDDPAALADQLHELKAQYIAGRFGKELKRPRGKHV